MSWAYRRRSKSIEALISTIAAAGPDANRPPQRGLAVAPGLPGFGLAAAASRSIDFVAMALPDTTFKGIALKEAGFAPPGLAGEPLAAAGAATRGLATPDLAGVVRRILALVDFALFVMLLGPIDFWSLAFAVMLCNRTAFGLRS